jgi:hypothetical protein
MVDDDDTDVRVKELVAAAAAGDAGIDPNTAADLARWFTLPSYQQLEESATKPKPAAPEDPEVVARREAIAKATAAVDPVFCDALYERYAHVRDLITYEPADLRMIDPSISAIDPVLMSRGQLGEPREVEIPHGLHDDLRECTPQAVLRDLHRPEVEFPLHLEVDPSIAAAMPIDATRVVREALQTRVGGGAVAGPSAVERVRTALEPIARAKREPWAELRTPGRRVSE